MPTFLRLTLVAALTLIASNGAHAAEPLTRIADIRALTREDAAKALPVQVRGVVTWRSADGQFTVQDASAGIWIGVNRARRTQVWAMNDTTAPTIAVGQLVEIEGLSDPAGYAPVILPKTIRVLAQKSVPPPHPMIASRFFSGADDSLRVEVPGVVQGYQPVEGGWLLNLNANPGRFTALFPSDALPDPSKLVDAEVRVTGVAITRFNTRGEITMPRIFSSRAEELVVVARGVEAFAAPLVPLDRIMAFRPEPIGPHRLRVVGTVTFALPGKFLYLQEGKSAVRVETLSQDAFAAGDRVEAAGFVDMTRFVGVLTEAQVKKIGRSQVPHPVSVNPEEIIAINTTAMETGLLAKPHDFDGHHVRFRARLLAVQTPTDSLQPLRRLTLVRGETILVANLHRGDASALDALLPGSELEVTAVVQLNYTPVESSRISLMSTRIEAILRSASDVSVVSSPSWWTAGRLLGGILIAVLALGASLLWAWQLRRQVRRKTHQLATEMHARRDAAIEFQATLRERNRLAANLHDTLLQTLGGIGFQIEACEAEAAAPPEPGQQAVHLPVARRMLDHAVAELRGSVWALRSLPLHGLALPDALRALAERAGAVSSLRIDVQCTGDLGRLSDFVAGNLVLAAQEAVHNAVKHGKPTHVTIDASPAEKPDWIVLTIRDDGSGFTPGTQFGALQGHFGLTGMRERIERLNGTLHIASALGQGTTIRFEVPLRSYDEDLA